MFRISTIYEEFIDRAFYKWEVIYREELHILPEDNMQTKSYLLAILYMKVNNTDSCLLYTSPSPRDLSTSRMPSSA